MTTKLTENIELATFPFLIRITNANGDIMYESVAENNNELAEEIKALHFFTKVIKGL